MFFKVKIASLICLVLCNCSMSSIDEYDSDCPNSFLLRSPSSIQNPFAGFPHEQTRILPFNTEENPLTSSPIEFLDDVSCPHTPLPSSLSPPLTRSVGIPFPDDGLFFNDSEIREYFDSLEKDLSNPAITASVQVKLKLRKPYQETNPLGKKHVYGEKPYKLQEEWLTLINDITNASLDSVRAPSTPKNNRPIRSRCYNSGGCPR